MFLFLYQAASHTDFSMEIGRRLVKWVSSWNISAWLAAILCLLPFPIMMFGHGTAEGAGDYPTSLRETLIQLILFPVAIVFLLPFISASQLVIFWFVRRMEPLSIRLILLLISGAALVPYYHFIATADLTSTSTAPLAALFYPIYIAFFAVPLSIVFFWIGKLP